MKRKNLQRGITDIVVILLIAFTIITTPLITQSIKKRQELRKLAAEDRCGPGTPGGCGNPNACCDWEVYENGCCHSTAGCANDSDCQEGKKCVNGVCEGSSWSPRCGGTELQCTYNPADLQCSCRGNQAWHCGNDDCWHYDATKCTTTNCSGVTDPCQNFSCDPGFHCENRNALPVCVTDLRPTPTPTSTPIPTLASTPTIISTPTPVGYAFPNFPPEYYYTPTPTPTSVPYRFPDFPPEYYYTPTPTATPTLSTNTPAPTVIPSPTVSYLPLFVQNFPTATPTPAIGCGFLQKKCPNNDCVFVLAACPSPPLLEQNLPTPTTIPSPTVGYLPLFVQNPPTSAPTIMPVATPISCSLLDRIFGRCPTGAENIPPPETEPADYIPAAETPTGYTCNGSGIESEGDTCYNCQYFSQTNPPTIACPWLISPSTTSPVITQSPEKLAKARECLEKYKQEHSLENVNCLKENFFDPMINSPSPNLASEIYKVRYQQALLDMEQRARNYEDANKIKFLGLGNLANTIVDSLPIMYFFQPQDFTGKQAEIFVDQTLDLAEQKPVTEFVKDIVIGAGREGIEVIASTTVGDILIEKVTIPAFRFLGTVAGRITPTIVKDAATTAGRALDRAALTPAREFVDQRVAGISRWLAQSAEQRTRQRTANEVAQKLAKIISENPLNLSADINQATQQAQESIAFLLREQLGQNLTQEEIDALAKPAWGPVQKALQERNQQLAKETADRATREAAEKAARDRAAQEAAQRAAQQAQQQAVRQVVKVQVSDGALVIQGAGTHGQDAVARSAGGRGFAAFDGGSLGRNAQGQNYEIAKDLINRGLAPNAPTVEFAQQASQIMNQAAQIADQSQAEAFIATQFQQLNTTVTQKYGSNAFSAGIAAGVNPEKGLLYVAKAGDCKAYSLAGNALQEIGPADQAIGSALYHSFGQEFRQIEVATYQVASSKTILMSDGIEKIFGKDPNFKNQVAQILARASDPATAQEQIMQAATQKSQQLWGKMPDDLSLIVFFTQ